MDDSDMTEWYQDMRSTYAFETGDAVMDWGTIETTFFQEATRNQCICACNHSIYSHNVIVFPNEPEKRQSHCYKCDCQHYASDNLEWLLKNRG